MTPTTDRVLPAARWLALAILPFLVVASGLLYLLPTRTDEHFAWTIEPPLTAMVLASAYIGGIWYFAEVLGARRWHHVKYGMPAVALFATLLGIATVLHADRFHAGHISFVVWAVLYATTPILVVAVLVANWRADRGESEDADAAIPVPARVALVSIGAGALLAGLTLFVRPELGVHWAWNLTPLTAQVTGAVLALPGAVNLWLLVDARWSAYRRLLRAQLVSLLFFGGALAVDHGSLRQGVVTALFVAMIAISLVIYAGVYAWCERRALKR